MQLPARPEMLRRLSLACAAASMRLTIITLVRLHLSVRSWTDRGGYVEGNEVANSLMMLIPTAVWLSLAAFVLGFLAYRRLPRPKPRKRTLELLLLAILGPLWIALSPILFLLVIRT